MDKEREFILSLLRCEVLKLGNFKLRSGDITPIYIDLRRIINYPEVMKDVVSIIRAKQVEENIKTDMVCGVPYTAIPIAAVFSTSYNIPMVLARKEAKDYGTKRLVEGVFKPGDSCLLIEDIICSGTSILEAMELLRKEGLDVHHCVVIVNRQQGGIDNLKQFGINVYPLFDIQSILNVYCSVNKVQPELIQKVKDYLKQNSKMLLHNDKNHSELSYSERAKISTHPIAKRLLQIMEEKKTNLCVTIDTDNCQELMNIAKQVGPHICLLKTHVDILKDFDENFAKQLTSLSTLYNFIIMEDRKFADIGNTVVQQYKNGLYKIGSWADIVTMHALPGDGSIEAIKSSTDVHTRACVIVAEMTTKRALTSENYIESALQIANNHADFVLGYVAKQGYIKGKNLICMSPGISLSSSSDSSNQKYRLPEDAIADGVDIIIVGRDICKSADITASATEYKTRSYDAYLKRVAEH